MDNHVFRFFRQLEHDSKILDFGKDDDDDTTVQTATTKKPETGNSNQTTPAANTSNTTKNTPTSKPPKEKDAKESGGKKSKNYLTNSKVIFYIAKIFVHIFWSYNSVKIIFYETL